MSLTIPVSAYTHTLGMGRPPKPEDQRRSSSYLLRLTRGELTRLEQASRQIGDTVAEILRNGAWLYIQKGKGGSRKKGEVKK
jgi:hypothetical protein